VGVKKLWQGISNSILVISGFLAGSFSHSQTLFVSAFLEAKLPYYQQAYNFYCYETSSLPSG